MLTPAQQATANQGSINAANAANASAGIIPTSQANSTTFVNPQNPSTSVTSTPPLNTSFSTPNQPATVNAPAVYTSQPAQNNLDHITANTNQANTDLQNFNTAQSTQNANTQTQAANTQQANTQTPDATQTDNQNTSQGSSLDPAISSILDELGGTTSQDQDTISNDEQTIQADQDQNAVDEQTQQGVAQSINAMNNGSYPLTATEQAQVSAIPSQYAGALALANSALQSATTYGVSANTGLSPQMAMSNIAVTIQKAQQNISKINSTILDAQQKLTTALQASDYKSATALYTQIGDAIKDRQSEISTMNSAINQTQTDIKDTITTQLQAVMDSNTMNYQQKQQALAQATLDEKTKNDLATRAIAAETASKGQYQIKTNPDGSESIFNTSTGEIVGEPTNEVLNGSLQPGQTGNPILDANTQTTSTGVPYIDGTNLTGATAASAQLAAAKMGIPYMGKAGASALQNIDAALTDLQQMQQTGASLYPSSGLTRPFNQIGQSFDEATQLGQNSANVNSYQSYLTDATKYLQGLAAGGTGLRINQASVQTMIHSLPAMDDTAAVAAAKSAVLTALLHSNERAMVGGKLYDAYNPNQAVSDLANLYKTSPTLYAPKIDALRKQNLDPEQILQVILP